MTDEIDYFFADRPLYTEDAVELLEKTQAEVDEDLRNGAQVQKSFYAVLQGEKESLQEYLDNLQQYDEFMTEAYNDTDNVPGVHVLGRVEDDMDMMARERDFRLDDTTFTGDSRREVLDEIMTDEVPRPVMSDTWIIMNEAEGLREYLERREDFE